MGPMDAIVAKVTVARVWGVVVQLPAEVVRVV
jgi:hypothetical protein